jgi:hypothetical protein
MQRDKRKNARNEREREKRKEKASVRTRHEVLQVRVDVDLEVEPVANVGLRWERELEASIVIQEQTRAHIATSSIGVRRQIVDLDVGTHVEGHRNVFLEHNERLRHHSVESLRNATEWDVDVATTESASINNKETQI